MPTSRKNQSASKQAQLNPADQQLIKPRRTNRPRIMFYVQHLLGIGHLMRARRIALALNSEKFDVTLVTGGLPVAGFELSGVEHIALPALAVSDGNFSALVDAKGSVVNDAYKEHRKQILLDVYNKLRPDVVMLEAFPFGRRQLRFELLPLIEAVRVSNPRPLLVSSIRDVLQRNRKPGRDEETANLINQYFDKILVHGDANFATLDESFPFADTIADKIAYTGLVSGPTPAQSNEAFDIVVSAGGGAVGSDLLQASIQAASQLPESLSWCVITGPYLPQATFDSLVAGAPANVTLERFRPDFVSLLANARLSVSQAGYNTVSDILQAQCRAVLIPFSSQGETEQADRARRLNKMGLATVLSDTQLTDNTTSGTTLADAIRSTLLLEPLATASAIDFNGAVGTATVLQNMLSERDG